MNTTPEPNDQHDRLAAETEVMDEIFDTDPQREWESKDGSLLIKYRKPKGLITLTIARVLGPTQAGNAVLEMYYRAAASIIEYEHRENGKRTNGAPQPPPTSDMQFNFIFGFIFKDEDDLLNEFATHWQMQFFPDLFAAMQEMRDSGTMTPEAARRMTENHSKSKVKKSPRRPSRRS